MIRIISYDTENSDDILWALKRVVDDFEGNALKQLKDRILESYK